MNVALIIFNRPEHTLQAFRQIAAARPERLFVIADGPRAMVPEDAAKVKAARAVTEAVDWPCEVLRNYADTNMGCGVRPSTGISWVFQHVEECIILEDDCVASPAFFRFCQEMLARYRDDESVMTVSGDQFLHRRLPGDSYLFSRYPLIWGWATWRRAWARFEFEMRQWPSLRETPWLRDLLENERASRYWTARFDYVANGRRSDIWDVAWVFATWLHRGMCIHPVRNLVSNIGVGAESTHTRDEAGTMAAEDGSMTFPLRHPQRTRVDCRYDDRLFDAIFARPPTLRERLSCRYTYGAAIRRIPVVGRLWAHWRSRKGAGAGVP